MEMTVTPSAVAYFEQLVIQEITQASYTERPHIRIEVASPGTLEADPHLTFCAVGQALDSDIAINLTDALVLYVAKASEEALTQACIDFITSQMGGQLSIKAPYLKGKPLALEEPLYERVQYVLDKEVNPNLALHKGFATLVGVNEQGVVFLKLGGGCHGCGVAKVTLKNGIEKTLKIRCPDVQAVEDVTDHAAATDPYC